ncbi:hypothetical protein ABIE09_001136 [Lysobacter enzymogenes]|uniref:hypothetical protein n=1 Tax=Lysobacter enzymogenes TaxID=69 RepID=UPI0033952A78
MILSALIITAPPMAGMFFNGVMGSYYANNSFQPSSGCDDPWWPSSSALVSES